MKKKLLVIVLCLFLGSSLSAQDGFKFAFLTDIHLNRGGGNSFEGFNKALKNVTSRQVDFILTGGDNVDVDGLKPSQKEVGFSLYHDFKRGLDQSNLPYYVTIGNHDRFWTKGEAEENLNEDGMFKKYFGKTYYSYVHKGWKFIVLNSTQIVNGKYSLDEQQLEWLKEELTKTSKSQPIIVSTHVPFLSVYYPVLEGRYTDTDTFSNQFQVFDMFKDHNLKLVLQGHMHLYEEIKVKGVPFVTAGAISANWWGGSFHGTEEGYLLLETEGDEVTWEYIDYGWDVNTTK